MFIPRWEFKYVTIEMSYLARQHRAYQQPSNHGE